jgi:hypothetical protein
MPVHGLTNDNWIGRERPMLREASKGTKMLASLGRCCWKQVRLGRGEPDVQQKGITGNTIFFAQPTADIPSMELPPAANALVDSFNIILTRNLQDLSHATWATIKRDEYMNIVRDRKAQCATFAHVVLREDEATTRLPADGIPDHIQCCTQLVEGSSKAPLQLVGPASRAPEIGKGEEAGDNSEESDDEEEARVGGAQPDTDAAGIGADQPDMQYLHENVAVSTIALDPVHDIAPVKMMQALSANITAMEQHAAEIVKNEKKAMVERSDGTLQPVVDEGGRHSLKSMVLDVQSIVRSFDHKTQTQLEAAQAGADARRAVSTEALAVPTQKPLDSFDARTWPACYTEWWFGDGAPNLARERPMLFEQVAQRLINLEELEYSLQTDTEPYIAACQSRFNTPEIIAVLGDVIRRLRLLKGTKAAIGRKGFSTDLKVIASATSEDFMEAMAIAKPRDSIGTACARADMPAKVKTALRTLLLSTSDVPGTEGP